jgi:hypothetical protein
LWTILKQTKLNVLGRLTRPKYLQKRKELILFSSKGVLVGIHVDGFGSLKPPVSSEASTPAPFIRADDGTKKYSSILLTRNPSSNIF